MAVTRSRCITKSPVAGGARATDCRRGVRRPRVRATGTSWPSLLVATRTPGACLPSTTWSLCPQTLFVGHIGSAQTGGDSIEGRRQRVQPSSSAAACGRRTTPARAPCGAGQDHVSASVSSSASGNRGRVVRRLVPVTARFTPSRGAEVVIATAACLRAGDPSRPSLPSVRVRTGVPAPR